MLYRENMYMQNAADAHTRMRAESHNAGNLLTAPRMSLPLCSRESHGPDGLPEEDTCTGDGAFSSRVVSGKKATPVPMEGESGSEGAPPARPQTVSEQRISLFELLSKVPPQALTDADRAVIVQTIYPPGSSWRVKMVLYPDKIAFLVVGMLLVLLLCKSQKHARGMMTSKFRGVDTTEFDESIRRILDTR